MTQLYSVIATDELPEFQRQDLKTYVVVDTATRAPIAGTDHDVQFAVQVRCDELNKSAERNQPPRK